MEAEGVTYCTLDLVACLTVSAVRYGICAHKFLKHGVKVVFLLVEREMIMQVDIRLHPKAVTMKQASVDFNETESCNHHCWGF